MTDRQDLPIPDYDHLPVTSLGQRIRSLRPQQVETLLAYEKEHGNRLPVTQVLQVRLDELAAGATPSDGNASDIAPQQAPPPSGGTGVSPQTEGPAQNPPSHGDPSNPAQPRT